MINHMWSLYFFIYIYNVFKQREFSILNHFDPTWYELGTVVEFCKVFVRDISNFKNYQCMYVWTFLIF